MAKLIHSRSLRSSEPHLHINCSTLNETLLESELFGHEKGSFTGAATAKPGLFEVADGGTLFLDEVAEMSAGMQAKLLQVLDNGELRRRQVVEGRFRRDLLFRLNVVSLELPPLRKRREDIPALVHLYLDRYRLPGQPVRTLAAPAMARPHGYSWPGNVRELANVIEGLVLLAQSDEIQLSDLPSSLSALGAADAEVDETEPLPLAEI
ncbi:MAG: sigma-54-dependent Fis family transcriptional regulator [Acidobacteria bacterium]|nr:sigma-54-dependent Fis family transcriptional regulator [Acidobacteriota bacterium]